MRSFLLQLLELQIPMAFGAFVCYVLGRAISGSTVLATSYRPGTYQYAIGDVLFLTVPVVAWMLIRGNGGQTTVAMLLGMLAPVAAVVLAGELSRSPYLLWLVTGMYPTMCLGMILYMLFRGGHLVTPRTNVSGAGASDPAA